MGKHRLEVRNLTLASAVIVVSVFLSACTTMEVDEKNFIRPDQRSGWVKKKESSKCRGFFDIAKKKSRIEELTQLMESADFWDHQEKAQIVISESNQLKSIVSPYEEMRKRFEDLYGFALNYDEFNNLLNQ